MKLPFALTAILLSLPASASEPRTWDETDCQVVQDYAELRRDMGIQATDAAAAGLLRDRDLLLQTLREANPEALEKIAPFLGARLEAFELGEEERATIRSMHALLADRCEETPP